MIDTRLDDIEPAAVHELRANDYLIELSEGGGGRSSCAGLALNRDPGDRLRDAHGVFIYLRDTERGERWAATPQPFADVQPADQFVASAQDIVFVRERHAIASRLTVTVDADGQGECRELELHNLDHCARRIELTSFAEVALAPTRADLDHPAFLKLFVQTRAVDDGQCLLAWRRPRAQGERWPLLFHRLLGAPVCAWETDRRIVLGRGGSAAQPALRLNGTTGNVLDPCVALRCVVELAPGERRSLRWQLGLLPAATDPLAFAAAPPLGTDAGAEPDVNGGLIDEGRAYQLQLAGNGHGLSLPPMPWINVIANPQFGCIVSETGAGASWARNSQANRLSPWFNDSVVDPHGEALWLRDDDSGRSWSVLPGPQPAAAPYTVVHGQGYSRFRLGFNDIDHDSWVFVARRAPIKCCLIELHNRSAASQRLSLLSLHELVLGSLPGDESRLQTDCIGSVQTARRERDDGLGDGIVFVNLLGAAADVQRLSTDRDAVIGRWRPRSTPRMLELDTLEADRPGDRPRCFARQLQLQLAPGETRVLGVVFGEATSTAMLGELLDEFSSVEQLQAERDAVIGGWRDALDQLRVDTPSADINLLTNGWLPYAALSCRIWGRTAHYQSSGAYGFRDQLQDAGNLALIWPQRSREQILLHARAQFVEGDVLHWWHPQPIARGLRTRFADDLLWLPWVTAEYLRVTADRALLDEVLPFLHGPALADGEDERYLPAEVSSATGSVYEHCCRAIDRSLRVGVHGLPLMGTGDWNDGMNRIGRQGRGESVWLGFFLAQILDAFAPLADARGEPERAQRYRHHRAQLAEALESNGWDGGWYRRAYYDDGTPLGCAGDSECRIDALVQAWSVLSGVAEPARAAQAMDAAEAQLIDRQHGLIRLLTPPFVETPHDPGYIRGYVAGVRENGGQYTHAACWVVSALARLGQRDRAASALEMIGPLWHSRNAEARRRYQVEPYVVDADIYGAEPHIGRGGWTWYTGSAGWAWRVAVEDILGLRRQGDTLILKPCVPDDWGGYTLDYRVPDGGGRHRIQVRIADGCSARVVALRVDGRALEPSAGVARWPLFGDGREHQIDVVLGA